MTKIESRITIIDLGKHKSFSNLKEWAFLAITCYFGGIKAKGQISKRVFQENKTGQIFRKNERFLPPDTHTYEHFLPPDT